MALSHVHKYLSRIRWAEILLNKINVHISSIPHSLRQMNERGENNSILFQVYSVSWVQYSLWCLHIVCFRFTGSACGHGWILGPHVYSNGISEFRVWWKYTILWSSTGDSYTLRVENNCHGMIIIALILITNCYPRMFIVCFGRCQLIYLCIHWLWSQTACHWLAMWLGANYLWLCLNFLIVK